MQQFRKFALATSLAASLLITNAAIAAPRDGDRSLVERIKSKIKAFIVHVLDDGGLVIPPGSH